MAIKVKNKGDFKNLERFLKKNSQKGNFRKILELYGRAGVDALASATPKKTGATAAAWYYTITEGEDGYTLSWSNDKVTNRGTPVVILLRYGHGTRNGGYVQGYDFISPNIRPIFDGFTDAVWKEVTS